MSATRHSEEAENSTGYRAKQTRLKTMTIEENRDESQLNVITVVSPFADFIPLMFVTKNKTFETERLAESHCYSDDEDVIRCSGKRFILDPDIKIVPVVAIHSNSITLHLVSLFLHH
jgi:hypothetical protein